MVIYLILGFIVAVVFVVLVINAFGGYSNGITQAIEWAQNDDPEIQEYKLDFYNLAYYGIPLIVLALWPIVALYSIYILLFA